MNREPLIDTLLRHGTEPRFDLRTFRHGLVTNARGHALKWHYRDAACPVSRNDVLRKRAGIRVLENLLEFMNTDPRSRCEQCAREAQRLMR